MRHIPVLLMFNKIHHHVDTEELERYSLGRLPEEKAPSLEEHLLLCEACRLRLEKIDGYTKAMARAAESLRRPKAWGVWRQVSILAAAACILLVLSFALRGPGQPQPALAVSLIATRANGSGAAVPAGRSLELHPDLTGLPASPAYRVEMVEGNGSPVWSGRLIPPENAVQASPQRRGLYFVRVYSDEGQLLREYGLELK